MRRSASTTAVAVALLAALAAGAVGSGARPSAVAPPSGDELARLAAPPVRTSIASQRVYFVFPDRYANGDPSNDRGGRAGARAATGFDPASDAYYHGGDLRGLTDDCRDPRRGLARIRALGFTAVWVTPPVKQKTVQGSTAAYHGYWGLDFTTVDPHLGTESEFAAFVDCAHRLGLKVYLDVVVNHTADVVRLRGGPSYVDPDERPWRDCRGRRFEPARFAGKTRFPCLAVARMPRVPFVPAGERTAKKPAWLNDVRRYHNRGDIDFSACDDVCFEQGDFFGLDDLFTEQRSVVDGLAAVHADWIRRFRVDGFRLDTAKHVDRAFFRRWAPKVLAAARAAGVRDFELFGEVWLTNAVDLSVFVRERGLPNVLDFPLQDVASGFVGGQISPAAVAARLREDDYFAGATGVAHTPPTFLGNHDMGRAAFMLRQKGGASGTALLRRVQLGYDLLYLLRGAPVVYYGDEVGMIGAGGDRAARQDLFPTAVPEWRTEERLGGPPIGTGSSFDVDHPIARRLRTLGALRDAHPALATGATVVRSASGNVLAVSRVDANARREYVAVFNAGASPARVAVATATPSTTWTLLHGETAPSASGRDGRLTVTVPGISALLLRADSQLPVAAPARPAVSVVADDVTELRRVNATVAGTAPVAVAFVVRRAGRAARWQRLAADDSPPYRALLDPRRFRRGERVHVAAIARSLDGRTAVSRVVAATPRR